jgi:cysteine desulfurase
MKNIYLDHSATTPVDKDVLEQMLPYFYEKYGNASSIHNFGQTALSGVDEARRRVADFLNCETDEVIFTSGSTESNNLAIKGFVFALNKKGINFEDMHAITSVVEHDAVLEPFMELEKMGVKVDHAPVDSSGSLDFGKFEKLINDKTVFVSIMWVNSEVGAIMPIKKIGKLVKKINEDRQKTWKNTRPKERSKHPLPMAFHTDATQAVNFVNCDVKWNYVDLLSLSGHKIYGPKGVGALYKKSGVELTALQKGGHHEKNMRSGTLNVPGIVGLGAAVHQIGRGEKGVSSNAQKKNNEYIATLRDRLVDEIEEKIPDIKLNTNRDVSTPSHAHFTFMGVEGESILISLDLEGIAVSTGSACASGSLKASHVLLAMGIDKEVAHYSVRFTLGKHNTEKEIDEVLEKLPPIIEKLRKMNPLYKK